eukprot:6192750-Pleurochrysis_carterae.AAC.1
MGEYCASSFAAPCRKEQASEESQTVSPASPCKSMIWQRFMQCKCTLPDRYDRKPLSRCT